MKNQLRIVRSSRTDENKKIILKCLKKLMKAFNKIKYKLNPKKKTIRET